MQAPGLFAAGAQGSRVTILIVTAEVGSHITIWRQYGRTEAEMNAAEPEIVRGCKYLPVTSPEQLFVDYEVPQDRFMQYWVIQSQGGMPPMTSGKMPTGPYDFGRDALFDLGNPKRGMLVWVESFNEYKYGISRDVQKVWGRRDPVVISGVREMWASSLSLLTTTITDRDKLLAIVQAGSTIAMSPRKASYGLDGVVYFAVGGVTESRIDGALASEESRRWTMEVQQIAPPPAEYRLPSYALTWRELADRDKWRDVADRQWWEAVAS